MGKIFSLQFQFSDTLHTALVSAGNDLINPYIHIQFIDSISKQLVIAGHIRYKGYGGYKKLSSFNDPYLAKLLEQIDTAIEKELLAKQAIVKTICAYFK